MPIRQDHGVPKLLLKSRLHVFQLNKHHQPSPDAILYGIPEGISSTLPWWTPFPGAILDILIGLQSLTTTWRENFGSGAAAWDNKLSMMDKSWVTLSVVEVVYMLIQVFSGLAYYGLYGWRQEFLRYGGATSYTLPFASAVGLWTKLVFQSAIARIASWILATLSLLLFVLLHLPDLGTGPLYGLWAPSCVPWDNVTATDWACANSTDLQIGSAASGSFLPKPVDWAFAGLVGFFLLWTAIIHLRFQFTGRRPQFQQRVAGTTMSFIVMIVLTLTILAFVLDARTASDPVLTPRVNAQLTLCPGVANTSFLTNPSFDDNGYINDTRCVDVQLDLPEAINDLRTAVQLDKANIARLIFNF